MISATGRQSIPNEWISFTAPNLGYVKPGFRDQVLERFKKENAASRAGLADRLKGGDLEARLTAEQKQYLKDNFDLKNMSWEDYQFLLDKLCEFGVLEEGDKKYLHGQSGGLDMSYVDFSNTCTASLYTAPVRDPWSFNSWKGDVLGWMKFLSSFQRWDADSQSWQKTNEARLFGKVQDLLGAIA